MKSSSSKKSQYAWTDKTYYSSRTVKLPSGTEVSILDMHDLDRFQITIG